MTYPQWATPERRAWLVELFLKSKGRCVYGHDPCPNPSHYYENYIEPIIADWISDDKAERAALWKREQELLHYVPDRTGWGKWKFDPIAREHYLLSRPPYYLEAVGSGHPIFPKVAKVRVPGTFTRLFVDVTRSKKLSKNKRRKARRYGFGKEESKTVHELVNLAIVDAGLGV